MSEQKGHDVAQRSIFVDWPLQAIQMYKLWYIMSMEDTLYAVIAIEADSRAERKSGAIYDVSLRTKYLFLSHSTTRAKAGDNLV